MEHGARFRVSSPTLQLLEFKRQEWMSTAGRTVSPAVQLEPSIARFGETRIGYELSLAVVVDGTELIRVAYRALFSVAEETEDPDTALHRIVTWNAPAILYPYIRECVQSTMLRGTEAGITLPVVDFRSMWALSDVEVPPFDRGPDEGERPPSRRAKAGTKGTVARKGKSASAGED